MKKITGFILLSYMIHTVVVADFSLTGTAAKQLYNIIPKAADQMSATIKSKSLGEQCNCKEAIAMSEEEHKEIAHYSCVVPDMAFDKKIHFSDKISKSLFHAMTGKDVGQRVSTSRDVVTLVRIFGAISCSERYGDSGQIDYRCTITP
ncbi:MAG TPA: hypothetical protein VEL47_02250 [Myxococcota bacterium]|nr:hypothetical protein [Myxococcota bacterium]